jgi:hypothetical protein
MASFNGLAIGSKVTIFINDLNQPDYNIER